METPKEAKVARKNLAELFNDRLSISVKVAHLHQAFQIPGGGTETSLSVGRPGLRDLEMVFHPGYGLVGRLKGKYFLSPSANVIVAREE